MTLIEKKAISYCYEIALCGFMFIVLADQMNFLAKSIGSKVLLKLSIDA